SVGDSADTSDPDAHEAARLAALMAPDETQLLYSMCLHGRAELGLAPDEYAALTMVLLRLLAFKPGVVSVMAAPTPGAGAEKKTLFDAPARAPSAAQPVTGAIVPGAPIAAPVTAPATALAPVQPPGYVLPVVVPPISASKPAQTLVAPAQSATKVVAIPVRVQAEPGERMQQRQEAHASARPASASFTATPEGDFWHATVQQLIADEAIAALVRELALQSQLVARDGDHWMLRVERESLNQPTSRERLRAALSAAGHVATISVEVGMVSDSPARRNAAAALERQRAAEEIILADPLVQSMMRDFGAKIVPGSIKPLCSIFIRPLTAGTNMF